MSARRDRPAVPVIVMVRDYRSGGLHNSVWDGIYGAAAELTVAVQDAFARLHALDRTADATMQVERCYEALDRCVDELRQVARR